MCSRHTYAQLRFRRFVRGFPGEAQFYKSDQEIEALQAEADMFMALCTSSIWCLPG